MTRCPIIQAMKRFFKIVFLSGIVFVSAIILVFVIFGKSVDPNMANKGVAEKAQAPAAPPAEPKAKDEPAEDAPGAEDAPPPEGEGEDAPPEQ